MKVLVVGGANDIVLKLEKALKNIDDSIRIINAAPAVFDSADWMQQHGIPDIILVDRQIIRNRQPNAVQNGVFKATVTFKIHSEEFSFQAFRINTLEHLFPNLPLVFPEHGSENGAARKPYGMQATGGQYRNRFLVKQGQRFASIETDAIAYFFSEGRFIFFKTFDNQKYLVEYTLEELEEMLNPQDFFRINRSLVISFRSVTQIHPYFGNRLKLYLDPPMEKEIIVSREKVHGFKSWLGQ